MSYGHNDHDLGFVQINNGKGEAMKNVTAGAVNMFRPAVWSLGNFIQRIEDGGYEGDACVSIALPVPIVTPLDFQPRQRVKAIGFTSGH